MKRSRSFGSKSLWTNIPSLDARTSAIIMSYFKKIIGQYKSFYFQDDFRIRFSRFSPSWLGIAPRCIKQGGNEFSCHFYRVLNHSPTIIESRVTCFLAKYCWKEIIWWSYFHCWCFFKYFHKAKIISPAFISINQHLGTKLLRAFDSVECCEKS